MISGVGVDRGLSRAAVYLLAAGLAFTSETRWPCPQTCRCSSVELEVNCSYGQLASLPDGLPKDFQTLNLKHNSLKALVKQQFQALTQLLNLDLSYNRLALIEVEAFLGLQSLRSLCLAHNQLKILSVGVFAGLSKLQFLDVSHNEILVFLDFTFRDSAALQVIQADDNDFVFIADRAFSGLTGLQELHLDACNLTAVPTEALAPLRALKRLSLQQFGPNSLPNFSFRHLERLKDLLITDCPWLETLFANSLFGLNLTSLTITNCNLSAVPYAPLNHLVYLVYLDLSFNPITYIQGNMLRDLLRLQEFHLVGGSLLYIEPGALRGLVMLTSLNVSKNLLTTLEEGVFHSVESLRNLGLDGNPLVCDCRLLWMAWRRVFLNFGGSSPTCSTAVQEWNFLDFSQSELSDLLICQRPRILNPNSRQVRIDQGHTVVLYCNAQGDPTPSITWFNPQLRVLSPVGRIRALANGSLEVRYAQPQDRGVYVCVASNAAGNDSLSVSLLVRGFASPPKNPFLLKDWLVLPSAAPGANKTQRIPFDMKTLLIAASIGFISFFSAVSVCFIFMVLWSKSKGQIKHTATIAYVPRSTVSTSHAGTSNFMETSRFTMKLI
ncbi:leucine-rich repeat and immunoglobulin-like domain-containing nogo receptor-interacting protein 1 [Neosynchiropus ocellatus]